MTFERDRAKRARLVLPASPLEAKFSGWADALHGRTPRRRTRVVFAMTVLLLLGGMQNRPLNAQSQKDRPSRVAGQFYPSDSEDLRRQVRSLIEKAKRIEGLQVMGLIAPHAGYIYSGATAGLAYGQVYGRTYDAVILLSPSHRDPFYGATIYPGRSYQTPLGAARIDRDLADQIVQQCPGVKFSELGHGDEHSLEVQVPFVQVALPQAPIVPMVIGGYDCALLERMALALARVLRTRNVLLVASSDLYHGNSYEEGEATNTRTLTAVMTMKSKELCEGFLNDTYQACGGGPITLMISTLKALGAKKVELLGRTNSNDVTGQRGGYVVGYAALAVCGERKKMENPNKIEFPALNAAAQKELLRMARQAITHYLQHHQPPVFSPTLEVLKEKRGVFVTLTKDGDLRGCIGYHESDRPLYELVPDRAIAAAFEDPRFPPLRSSELDQIHIKVSVYLTNVYKINSLDEFHMGEHGIIMTKNNRGATYLPEVPLEAGWKTVDEEMESLCHKAGLPSNAWKQGAEFFVYKTQVFGEK